MATAPEHKPSGRSALGASVEAHAEHLYQYETQEAKDRARPEGEAAKRARRAGCGTVRIWRGYFWV